VPPVENYMSRVSYLCIGQLTKIIKNAVLQDDFLKNAGKFPIGHSDKKYIFGVKESAG